MRRVDERLFFRLTAGLTSGVLAGSAALAAALAREHMALCGAGSAPHCGWCVASAGLALAAVAALPGAVGRGRRPSLSTDAPCARDCNRPLSG
jgi:hypothetical protein